MFLLAIITPWSYTFLQHATSCQMLSTVDRLFQRDDTLHNKNDGDGK